MQTDTPTLIRHLADRIRGHLHQEFPTWSSHLVVGDDRSLPRERTPVFYGSYDWHSNVHSTWALVRASTVLRDPAFTVGVADLLGETITADGVATEAATFARRILAEVPYGATWLLRLSVELRSAGGPFAALADILEPLRVVVAKQTRQWLDTTGLPDRSGQHRDTAWNLHQFRRYATSISDEELVARIDRCAVRLYRDDDRAPVAYEPGANQFLSPSLEEARLMAVVDPVAFEPWLARFLPLFFDEDASVFALPPAPVRASDYHQAHIVALPFTRASALHDIAAAVSQPRVRERIDGLAVAHLEHGLSALDLLDDYASGHWVPTFAIDALLR
jgi:hypothetical protein